MSCDFQNLGSVASDRDFQRIPVQQVLSKEHSVSKPPVKFPELPIDSLPQLCYNDYIRLKEVSAMLVAKDLLIKLVAKIMVKSLVATKVKINFGDEFYYTFGESAITIPSIKEEIDWECEKNIYQYFQDMGMVNYNVYTYSILHEIGHFWSDFTNQVSDEMLEESAKDTAILRNCLDQGFIDHENSMRLYYQDKLEMLANQFAKATYKVNKRKLDRFDKIFHYLVPNGRC
jgi:hypothetical protein